MLGKGYESSVEIHRPGRVIAKTKDGLKEYKTGVWIKLSTSFRDVMKTLKGSRLAVFLDICLHIDENNDCFPSVETIRKDTGYSKRETINAIQELEDMNLLTVTRGERRYNIYHVNAIVAIGAENAPVHFVTSNGAFSANKMSQSALKEEPINKKKFKKNQTTGATASQSLLIAYESSIGEHTPMMRRTLANAETLYPSDWIIEALQIAAENNVKRWTYAEAILKRWTRDGKVDNKNNGNGKHKTTWAEIVDPEDSQEDLEQIAAKGRELKARIAANLAAAESRKKELAEAQP
jgi:DnaD/phage-associated family protein